MSYEEWLRKVDGLVAAKIGVGTSDLEDAPHRDYFEDGFTPEEYAKEFVSDYLYDNGLSDLFDEEDEDYE